MSNDYQNSYWWKANGDFEIMNQKHDTHEQNYNKDSLCHTEVFESEKNRVTRDWDGKPSQAGRSVDSEIEKLTFEHQRQKTNYILSVSEINRNFEITCGHFWDMLNDAGKGVLSNEKFKEFVAKYKAMFEKNKQLGLVSWMKPSAEKILSKIAEIEQKVS